MHDHALPSNPGTQWVVVSAGIAQERVGMARSQMLDADRMLQRPSASALLPTGTRRSTEDGAPQAP